VAGICLSLPPIPDVGYQASLIGLAIKQLNAIVQLQKGKADAFID